MNALRRSVAFVLALLLAVPGEAVLVVRPGPVAAGSAGLAGPAAAAVTNAAPRWAGSFGGFLRSPAPDAARVRAIARELETLDASDPMVRAGLRPLAAQIRTEAARLLETPVAPNATEADLRAAMLKFEVLNYPAVRALLEEDQKGAVGAAAWAYNRNLWDRESVATAEKIAAIAAEIGAAKSAARPLPASSPKAAPGPDLTVEVIRGDITRSDADAVLTTVMERRLCGGGVNAAIAASEGGSCFAAQLQKAPALGEGETLHARGDGVGPIKSVLFLGEHQTRPLSEVVYDGLVAAEKRGLTSLAFPALRAGSVFGAIESSYREIAAQLRRGVEKFLAEGGRASLSKLSFFVHNDAPLAAAVQKTFEEAAGRERSLRTDLREARLSGAGFTMTPNAVEVSDRSSPIYASLNAPWDLKHLREVHRPVTLGRIQDKAAFSAPTPSVLNMPIKMIGGEIRVPAELAQFKEFLQTVIDHEKAVNPDFDEYYMYLTVDQHEVKKGTTHRRPGVHIDGVQGARYAVKLPPEHLYSASDRLGTVFYDQEFDLTHLDPAKQHVHAELERQAREENARRVPDYDIAFWDSYSVHRADEATEDFTRTFVRVEFSKKRYDSVGDTHNPLFDYRWRRVERPIPAELDDRPAPRPGYDAALDALEPGQEHTVKDLGRWIEDNLGAVVTRDAGARFLIAEGDSFETRAALEAEGWRFGAAVEKETGFHQVLPATAPDGSTLYAILGVNARSRVVHLQSFLKLLGVPPERVLTRSGFRSWKREYLDAFRAAGHVPDVVVYGLTRPAVSALIPETPENAAFWRDFNSKKSEPPPKNDVSRRPMKIVTLADGRRVWFFMPLFGELAGDLMDALLEHGARNIAVLSAAGSIDPEAKLGDWQTPAGAVDDAGRPLDLSRLAPVPEVPRAGVHMSMPTSNTQTREWTRTAAARGVTTVDMELGPILRAFASYPDAALTLAFVISDVMTGPNRTDLTETRIGKIPGLAAKAGEILARLLGVKPGSLRAVGAENRAFPTRGRD